MGDCQFKPNFALDQYYCIPFFAKNFLQRRAKIYAWNRKEVVSFVYRGGIVRYEGCCMKHITTPDNNSKCIREGLARFTWTTYAGTFDPNVFVPYTRTIETTYFNPALPNNGIVPNRIYNGFRRHLFFGCNKTTVDTNKEAPTWTVFATGAKESTIDEFVILTPPVIDTKYHCKVDIFQQLPTGEIEVLYSNRLEGQCPYIEHTTVESPAIDRAIEVTLAPGEWLLVTKKFLAYNAFPVGYCPYNAINVYIVSTLGVISSFGSGTAVLPFSYAFHVAQLRNLPNCPHPRVEVVCEPIEKKEKCPPGTCEVDCGNVICCYDNQGNPVKTISK